MIQKNQENLTLLQFLRNKAFGSNRFIKKGLEQGLCKVNGKIERFGSRKLLKDDVIQFDSKRIKDPKAKEIFIIHENENYYVLNKPIGIECAKNVLQSYFPNCELVHRLDKTTSGVFLLAKNVSSQQALSNLFRLRKMEKTYIAYVDGIVEEDRGEVSSYLIRKKSYQGQTIWGSSTSKQGLHAITSWEVLDRKSDYSILKCYPRTGRTHQIRVHLKEIGHPILGDFQYCRHFKSTFEVSRLYLHAEQISFTCPFSLKDVKFFAEFNFCD